MSCADLRPVIDLIGLGLDDAIEGDGAAARAHLATCAACTARVSSLGSSARALATAPAAPATGAARRAELVARMAAAAEAPARPARSVGRWLVVLVLIAGAAVASALGVRAQRDTTPSALPPTSGPALDPSPAAVTSDSGVIFYASPRAPLEGADPRPDAPEGYIPVGK